MVIECKMQETMSRSKTDEGSMRRYVLCVVTLQRDIQ